MVSGESLFDRLGEMDFLAFVYVAEADAVEQFNVYLDRSLPDADTTAALRAIIKDEAFHVSYSRAECDRYRRDGQAIDHAIRLVRWRRAQEGWMRFTRNLGEWTSGFWLLVAYFTALGPFRLLARLEPGGWHAPAARPAGDALRAARLEG